MKTWQRHVASALVLGAFLAFNTATSKPTKSGGGTATASPPITTTSPTTAPRGRRGVDVDLGDVRAAAGCSATTKSDGCECLGDFAHAAKWSPLPKGRESFAGRTYGRGGPADGRKNYFFLTVKPAPGATGLAGLGSVLITDNAAEDADAESMVSALEKGKAAPKSSGAAKFIRGYEPPEYTTLIPTDGPSFDLTQAGVETYVRELGERVLIVEFDDGKLVGIGEKVADKAKVWCSELYPLK
jgi:hypothetical protein